MTRGGKRSGAGRPKGTGKHGETTKPMRVPVSMINEIADLIEGRGYACPLYSSRVAAGNAVAADNHVEAMIDLNKQLIRSPEDTFFVNVSGESMIDVGIFPDDMLVVDRSIPATNGKIVVAAVNGEMTVKRLQKSANSLILMPENATYEPIIISAEMDFQIMGVVTSVVHSF